MFGEVQVGKQRYKTQTGFQLNARYALTNVTVIFGVVATHPVGCFCGITAPIVATSLQSKIGLFSAAGFEGKQEAQSQTTGSDTIHTQPTMQNAVLVYQWCYALSEPVLAAQTHSGPSGGD